MISCAPQNLSRAEHAQVAESNLRVLYCSSFFPRPEAPNAGIYNLHLCRALADAGSSVRVFCPRSWLDRSRGSEVQANHLTDARPKFEAIEYPRYFYTPGICRSAYGSFMWHSVRRSLRRVLAQFKPDFLLSYWAHPDGAVAARAAKEAGAPSVVQIGGSDVLILPKESASRRRQIIQALLDVDVVVTVSKQLRHAVIDLGIPPEKVHVMYQGVDSGSFYPGSKVEARARLGIPVDGPVLLFVGNLLPVKGLEVLIGAMEYVKSRHVLFKLYLVGQGPLRAKLEQEIAARGLTEQVSFVGGVSQHVLGDWYRAANLTLLSSHSEGIPNVLRESNACGTPFVATRVGGIEEIANEPVNMLVPPKAPLELGQAVVEMLNRPTSGEARRLGGGSWEQSAERLMEIVRPLLPQSRQRVAVGGGA